MPSVKKELWGGEFWTDGYFMNTVEKTDSEAVIQVYVKEQGKEREYKQLHFEQLKLL